MKNTTMLTDLYQLTMMQGHFLSGNYKKRAGFSNFFRTNPFNGNYSIWAGLEQVIEYIKDINFTASDIDFLNDLEIFHDDFLEYLKTFKFTGNITAIPEGTVIFPNEPTINVFAPINEAQFIESRLLNITNHQSLIATKASRIVKSAKDKPVIEMGLRRGLGGDSALYGTRASIIGGCSSTSNVMACKLFGLPNSYLKGTMAHSWIMSHDTELEAFGNYAKYYNEDLILLLDTYDTIHSGLYHACKIFRDMEENGILPKNYGVRLDSGNLDTLSTLCRTALDEAGFTKAKIIASNDLEENSIKQLEKDGANIDAYGVGSNLITGKGSLFNGVYKLVCIEDEHGNLIPKMKYSEDKVKATNPCLLNVKRFYFGGQILYDLLALDVEETNDSLSFMKRAKQVNLHVPIFENGECVYKSPALLDIRQYCKEQMETVCSDVENAVPVMLSDQLLSLRNKLFFECKEIIKGMEG